MKILHITNLGYEHGGVETGLVLLKPLLEKAGHTVKILTSNARPDLPHFSDFEFDALEHQPKLLQLFYRLFYPKAYTALKKVLKEYDPDIVHIHTISQISPSILFLLKNRPTVVTVHQTEDFMTGILLWSFPVHFFTDGSYTYKALTVQGRLHYLYHRFIGRIMYVWGFKNVDVFIAISRYMQAQLALEGLQSTYVPNSTKLFTYAEHTSFNTLLFVGRLEYTKGVQDCIEALPIILETFPDTRLVIVGRGGYRDTLEALARKCGVEKSVEFLGFRTRDELSQIYKNATVVVMPSIWPEAFGNVGIEAMSVGRPVVATQVGGTADWLVDGKTGYFVPPQDPKALAQKVSTLLSSRELLLRMSRNARQQALHFTIENHLESLLSVYKKISSKKKS